MTHDSGDRTAEQWLEHSQWLRGLARRLVLDEQAADDLCQDAWRTYFARGPERVRNLRAYLFGALSRLALKRRESDANRIDRERDATREWPSEGQLEAEIEMQRALVDELGKLPEPLRGTILLRYYEGHSAAEIARVQELPAATVRARLKRGVDALRARMERRFPERAWAIALWPRGDETTVALSSISSGVLFMSSTLKLFLVAALAVVVSYLFFSDDEQGDDRIAPASSSSPGPRVSAASFELPVEKAGSRRMPTEPIESAHAAKADAMPFRIRVVDARDGRGLPEFELEIRGPDEVVERPRSDATGCVQTESLWCEGPIQVRAIDHPESFWEENPTQEYPLAGIATFAVDVGPTWYFETVLPENTSAEDFFVAIHEGVERVMASYNTTPLRDGTRYWARFELADQYAEGESPWRIAVSSRDGFWWGEAVVTDLEGDRDRSIPITLVASGALTGRAHAPTGSPPPDGWIEARELSPLGRAALTRLEPLRAGRFRFRHLPTGDYALTVHSKRYGKQAFEFRVDPLVVNECELQLESGGDLERISGVLVVEGDRLEARSLDLLLLGEEQPSFLIDLGTIAESGEYSFEFDAVPEGDYRLLVLDRHPGVTWNLRPEHPVSAGETTLRIDYAIPSARPGGDYRWRMLDADTGAPISHGHLGLAGGQFPDRFDIAGKAQALGFPDELALDWMAHASGYRPLWGDREDFGGAEVLTLRLELGWGTELFAQDGQGSPVAGLIVRADGRELGRTDDRGRLRLELDAEPQRIELEHRGWRVMKGAWNPDSGRLDVQSGGTPLVLLRK